MFYNLDPDEDTTYIFYEQSLNRITSTTTCYLNEEPLCTLICYKTLYKTQVYILHIPRILTMLSDNFQIRLLSLDSIYIQ